MSSASRSSLSAAHPSLQRGFTLVELLVYMLVVVVFLIGLTNFAIDIILARAKTQSMQEVQQNARVSLLKMSREIRNAAGVNAEFSVFGTNPGVLSLSEDDPDSDPIVFDAPAGRLRIKRGENDPQYLTADSVTITNLVFTDLGGYGSPANVKIELSAEHVNPENIQEFKASLDAETAVSLRND